LPDKPTLQEQLDEIRQELNYERTGGRTRVRISLEVQHEHMDEVLDILNYRNISRVWIERKEAGKGVTARIRRSTFTWSESRTRDHYTRIRSRI